MTGTVSSGKVLTREEAPFDPDALRDRYRAERDKRASRFIDTGRVRRVEPRKPREITHTK